MGAPVVYKNLKQIIGNHLLFCREGTTVAANVNAIGGAIAAPILGATVSALVLPPIGVPGAGETMILPVYGQTAEDPNWSYLGITEKLALDVKVMKEDVTGPIPGSGVYGRLDVAVAGMTLDINFTQKQMNQLVWDC